MAKKTDPFYEALQDYATHASMMVRASRRIAETSSSMGHGIMLLSDLIRRNTEDHVQRELINYLETLERMCGYTVTARIEKESKSLNN